MDFTRVLAIDLFGAGTQYHPMSFPVILHVEDDSDDAFLLQAAFQIANLPFSIAHVSDGQQAIDYLSGTAKYGNRTQFPAPVSMLLDINMPVLSGFEVLSWARKHPDFRDLPIYMLTSSDFAHDRQCAQLLGSTGYFVKTHTFTAVIDHFRTIAPSLQANLENGKTVKSCVTEMPPGLS